MNAEKIKLNVANALILAMAVGLLTGFLWFSLNGRDGALTPGHEAGLVLSEDR